MFAKISMMVRMMLLVVVAFFAFSSSPSMAQAQPDPPPSSSGSSVFDPIRDFFSPRTFEKKKQSANDLIKDKNCIACEVFNQFASAVFSASNQVDSAGPGLIPVLTGFASVFSLFYLGSAFVSGDASDLLGRWQVFWRLLIMVSIASALLQAPLTYAWDLFIGPAFSLGRGVTNLMGASPVNAECVAAGISAAGLPEGAKPVLDSMSSTVCGAYKLTLNGIATGLALMQPSGLGLPQLAYVVAGLFVVVIYGFLAITFPLRFIDIVVKMVIVGALTPILIVCFVFKPARGYCGIAVSTVLNAVAQFTLVTVMFSIGEKVFTSVTKSMNLDNVTDASDFGTAIFNAFIIIALAYVFQGLLKSVPALAAEISRSSGGGGTGGGDAAVGAVGRVASAAATTAGAVAAAPVAMYAAPKVANAIGRSINRAQKGVS